ncbi:FixH family protein [Macrococcus sp. DPC7161]|uniref:FixH family protein n=1 Tax=Macrococcus sp. DPC7161 TaxID=2507060 RepID=UPI0013E9752A|nr:FixH family protein [Macrococcus sp. DPC7161]
MKKVLVLLSMLLFLTACSKDYSVKVTEKPKAMQDAPFTVQIKENNNAYQDYKGKAVFKMKGMDHGTIEAQLKHDKDGEYHSKVNLPMAGKWTISFKDKAIDKTIDIDVE